MIIFDSHAHYDDARFENEFKGGQSAVLSSVFMSGVKKIVNVGADIPTSENSVRLAEKYDDIYAAVGIHPSECGKSGTLGEEMAALRRLLKCKKVKAIGEIGLDFHWDDIPREMQVRWFESQLELAQEVDMPVCIHDREAHGECFNIIKAHGDVRGVMHSYSGSAEMARQLVNMGWYISFSGVITFKNAARMAEVVQSVPLDRILVETDCPYLTPHPYRGRINHSGYLIYTLERLAEIHEISPDAAAKITYDNACRFYGIEDKI